MRLVVIPGVLPSEFTFFTEAVDNADVRKAYEIMQSQYVLRNSDQIAYEKAMEAIAAIQAKLAENPSWTDYT